MNPGKYWYHSRWIQVNPGEYWYHYRWIQVNPGQYWYHSRPPRRLPLQLTFCKMQIWPPDIKVVVALFDISHQNQPMPRSISSWSKRRNLLDLLQDVEWLQWHARQQIPPSALKISLGWGFCTPRPPRSSWRCGCGLQWHARQQRSGILSENPIHMFNTLVCIICHLP